jgi:Skp family chaperone for outer membrane proteins
MKRAIRLRENELKRMISESVKRVLRESQFSEDQIEDWYYSAAQEMGYEDFVVSMWVYYLSKNKDIAEEMLNSINDSLNEPFPDGYRKFGY